VESRCQRKRENKKRVHARFPWPLEMSSHKVYRHPCLLLCPLTGAGWANLLLVHSLVTPRVLTEVRYPFMSLQLQKDACEHPSQIIPGGFAAGGIRQLQRNATAYSHRNRGFLHKICRSLRRHCKIQALQEQQACEKNPPPKNVEPGKCRHAVPHKK